MDSGKTAKNSKEKPVTVEDVNRVLDLGRLLFSVLTPEEIETLQAEFSKNSASEKIGNTGDS